MRYQMKRHQKEELTAWLWASVCWGLIAIFILVAYIASQQRRNMGQYLSPQKQLLEK